MLLHYVCVLDNTAVCVLIRACYNSFWKRLAYRIFRCFNRSLCFRRSFCRSIFLSLRSFRSFASLLSFVSFGFIHN